VAANEEQFKDDSGDIDAQPRLVKMVFTTVLHKTAGGSTILKRAWFSRLYWDESQVGGVFGCRRLKVCYLV